MLLPVVHNCIRNIPFDVRMIFQRCGIDCIDVDSPDPSVRLVRKFYPYQCYVQESVQLTLVSS